MKRIRNINSEYSKYKQKNKALQQANLNLNDRLYLMKLQLEKLSKTLRSRLNSVIKCKQATKSKSTLELTGCSLEYLKGHLEAKFESGLITGSGI